MSENKNNPDLKSSITVTDMYKDWYLDYASYVILERAIPRYEDGLKPVQRRILHALKEMDDGRFHKVANVIGQTMQYHPHGDAAINDALISIGQKELLIETQGNWGDSRTGDKAAAARYIETRLSNFSNEVAFNKDITILLDSYDGRKQEPEVLPIKFPILLYQGVEGIAVGLSTKILPHNFNEILKSMISYLKGRAFTLYPDFKTGGYIDIDHYNQGKRGGKIRVRSAIDIIDKNKLIIKNTPYGVNTNSLIESIVKANDKGKIKIKSIEDNTAEDVEIIINLIKGTSPDITIDALYAFTNCEVSISPNCCVIINNSPQFISVNKLLKISTDYAISVFKKELEHKLNKFLEKWHFQTLEIIFISNKIYRKMEKSTSWDSMIAMIEKSLEPFRKDLKKDVSVDDIEKLTELKIKRISKYDLDKAKKNILTIEEQISSTKRNLNNLVDYAIDYYETLMNDYGKNQIRSSSIEKFDSISVRRVAIANKKLYVNKKDGFIGFDLKADEFVSECSELDNIIVFLKNGTYMVTQVGPKKYIGNNIIYAAIWKKNDSHMIYNYIYKDSNSSWSYVKRFSITSAIRDRVYTLTKNEDKSKAIYLTANPNSEAEIISIDLDFKSKARVKNLEYDFSKLDIKSKNAKGNILTKYSVRKIEQRSIGESTLGGKDFWLDEVLGRLNHDERGRYLGKFNSKDTLLIVKNDGVYSMLKIDLNYRFKVSEIKILEKFIADSIFSCMYYDGETKNYFIKRFKIETKTLNKEFIFINESKGTRLLLVSIDSSPLFKFNYHSNSGTKKTKHIDVADFVQIKGWKSRGNKVSSLKRMSGFEVLEKEENEESDEIDGFNGNTMNLFE